MGMSRVAVAAVLVAAAAVRSADFTFVIWSDPHFGAYDGSGYRDNSAQDIATLAGTAYPTEIGGVVGTIEFVLVPGDITENSYYNQYEDSDGETNDDFISCINRWFTFPTYEITGNHDSWNPPGCDEIRQAIAARHGATSYSFDWQGVHFIGLDGGPDGDEPFGSGALDYLEAHMPTLSTQQAVIVSTHYRAAVSSTSEWDRIYNAVQDHNVILLCHGHDHYPLVGTWQGFDYLVTSDCKIVHGNQAFSVVHITDTRLTAIAYDWYSDGWYERPTEPHDHVILDKAVTGIVPPLPIRPARGVLVFQDGRKYPDGTVYAGTSDAHIIQKHSTNNAGASEVLEACRDTGADSGADRSILVRFSDLDTSCESRSYLHRAVLTLEYFGGRSDPGGVQKALHAHRLLHDWGEGDNEALDGAFADAGEVSWSRPFGSAGGDNPFWSGTLNELYCDPVPLDSQTLGGVEDYGPLSFDVTEAVADHLGGPGGNFGFVLREEFGSESDQDGTRQFRSREYGMVESRPSLTLEFIASSPPGFHQPGWNLVSVPVEPADPEVEAVFADMIAEGNVMDNCVYRYDPGAGYATFPADFTQVERGRGYWVFLETASGDTVVGVDGPAADGDATVPLADGWNLIGHPFESSVPWASCSIDNGAAVLSVADAAAAGWIEPILYYYEPGSGYGLVKHDGTGDDDASRPWRGYWLLCLTGGLDLIVPIPTTPVGLQNPGFETGDLTGWGVEGEGIDGVRFGPWYGGCSAHTGTYFAANAAHWVAESGSFYQSFDSLMGEEYSAGAWSWVYWVAGEGSVDPEQCTRSRIGLDPLGGTDPGAASVVWSSWDIEPVGDTGSWDRISVTATAQGNRMTVFLQLHQELTENPETGQWHVNAFDDAVVERLGQ